MNVVETWDEAVLGPIDEAAVRRWFKPAYAYRVSPHHYPAGTAFPGTHRAGACFILEGDCTFEGAGYEVALVKGEYVRLPEGDFRFRTRSGVQLIQVWLLPPEVRSLRASFN